MQAAALWQKLTVAEESVLVEMISELVHQGGGDCEISVITTICAHGTALHPTIIFKGKNFMKKWGIIMYLMPHMFHAYTVAQKTVQMFMRSGLYGL